MTDNKFSLDRFINGEKAITKNLKRTVEYIKFNQKVDYIYLEFEDGKNIAYTYRKDGKNLSGLSEGYDLIMAHKKKKIYFCLHAVHYSVYFESRFEIEMSRVFSSIEDLRKTLSERKIIKIFEEEIDA